ncbi:MAG TPA: hypothetical protein VGJ33_18680 [Candidatus Angelobacter sp.]|jgi:hypothetical protein
MTIVFLAHKLPDPISDELARQGHSVYECLAISEVFALAEEHLDAQIIIAAEMEEKWARLIQQRYPTFHLKAGATAKDVLWELNVKSGRVN